MIRHPFDRDDVDLAQLRAELASALGSPVEMLTSRANSEEPGVLILEDPDTGEHLDVDPGVVAGVVAAHQSKSRKRLLLEEFDAASPATRMAVLRKWLAQEVDLEDEHRRRSRLVIDRVVERQIRERRRRDPTT